RELAVTELPGRPAQLLPLRDGRILVTLRDTNRLIALEPGAKAEDPLATRCERATFVEPIGLAVSPDGARIAVTAGWDHRLMLRGAAPLATARVVDVAAEPRGVLIAADGATAYVAHMTGGVVSTVALDRPDQPAQRTYVRPARAIDARSKAPGAKRAAK